MAAAVEARAARRTRLGPAWLCLALAGASTLPAAAARAELTFEIEYIDPAGEGFYAATLHSPAPGNPALTLGEQRRTAFERAIEIWAGALTSQVPVRVRASFAASSDLPCDERGAVLGSANPASVLRGFTGAPRADHFYPSALADRLAGLDLDPGNPDILAQFNPRLDTEDCLAGIGWDYSIGERAGPTSFLNTVLHELAHGLGFTNLVDASSGSPSPGFSPFDALLYDDALGRYWDRMSSEERAASARRPHQLLWAGSEVSDVISRVLARGNPFIELDEAGARSFVLQVAELPGEPRVAQRQVQGPLRVYSDVAGCESEDVAGAIVLVRESASCPSLGTQLSNAARAGAVGAIVRSVLATRPPTPPSLSGVLVLPALAVSEADYTELLDRAQDEPSIVASLRADAERELGTSPRGWIRMNATDPVTSGSSVAHWDASVRRVRSSYADPAGLLMEPIISDSVANEIDELTIQLLSDIGWSSSTCGNGTLEPGEVCDRGTQNDDALVDGCRSDCRLWFCGDGVVDSDELCDDGQALGDCPRDCGREANWSLPQPWDGSPQEPIENLADDPTSDDAVTDDDPTSNDAVTDDDPTSDDAAVDDSALDGGAPRDAGGGSDSPLDDTAPDDASVDDSPLDDATLADASSDDSPLDDARDAGRSDAGSVPEADAGDASTGAASDAGRGSRQGSDGCACRMHAREGTSGAVFVALLGALAFTRRRERPSLASFTGARRAVRGAPTT